MHPSTPSSTRLHAATSRSSLPFLLAGAAGVLLLTVFAPTAAAQAASEAKPSPPAPDAPTVAVGGRGEVRAEPDEATVALGVTAQAETAGAAQQEANRIAGRILAAVRALGIEDKAVQTSRISLYPVYADQQRRMPQQQPEEPRIVGYRASNVVSVRLEDLAKIGPVIDATVEAGANEVQGVSFALRDDSAQRRDALAKAVADGRAKAETLAAALGLRLGPVLHVEEAGVQIDLPQVNRSGVAMMRMESSAPTPVAAGEVSVSGSVNLLYRLLPAEG